MTGAGGASRSATDSSERWSTVTLTDERRRAWKVAGVVVLACAALVAGLGVVAGRGDDVVEVPQREDGLAVSTYEPEGLGLTSDNPTLTGTVDGVDGCLVVRGTGANAGEVYVPVFDIEAAHLSTALVAVGTSVELRGAWVSRAPELSVPPACSSQDRFWRVART